MTITVEISAEVQAELSNRAAENGSFAEAYAASLIEAALRVSPLPRPWPRLSAMQLDEALREMAQFSHKIPALPDSAFTRESLYQDHD